jgi:hypothetical protein
MAEPEFWQDLVLVIIPVATAFFTTKFVLETWQDRKVKYELQEKILNQLDSAHTNFVLELWGATYQVARHYFDEATYDYNREKKRPVFDPIENFPDEKSQQPSKKFSKELERIHTIELWKAERNSVKFGTLLSLYYGKENKELDAMRGKLYRMNQKITYVFWDFLHSENAQKFSNNFDEVYDKFFQAMTDIKTTQNLIVNTKMKKRKI